MYKQYFLMRCVSFSPMTFPGERERGLETEEYESFQEERNEGNGTQKET